MLKRRLRCYWLFAVLLCVSSMEGRAQEGEEIRYPTEYVFPIADETVIPLPLITLKGKILRHTFPGVPNYESIEDGDVPETRWVLVIQESEIQRLAKSKYIPQEDIYCSEQRGWVQLISPGKEQDLFTFLNKQVIVEGYLGTLVFHIHTPITIEATSVYEDSEKIN